MSAPTKAPAPFRSGFCRIEAAPTDWGHGACLGATAAGNPCVCVCHTVATTPPVDPLPPSTVATRDPGGYLAGLQHAATLLLDYRVAGFWPAWNMLATRIDVLTCGDCTNLGMTGTDLKVTCSHPGIERWRTTAGDPA